MSNLRLSLLALALLAAPACATVQPWEREHLAKPCMAAAFGESSALAAQYRAKVLETTTGGGLPGDAPGGGCGCSQ